MLIKTKMELQTKLSYQNLENKDEYRRPSNL